MVAALTRAYLAECEHITRSYARTMTRVVTALPPYRHRPELYWERTGDGQAVLLIMGLGLSGGAWWRTVPELSEHMEVLTFDNRGVGRSRTWFHAWSTEVMADDAVSVLDAAGISRAHVYGISLGGMVAQQIALRHPTRVRSLVLGATFAGGRRATRPDRDVQRFLTRRPFMNHAEAARQSVRFNYGPRCREEHPERIDEDIAQRLTHPFSAHAYRAQMWAGSIHDTYARLPRITAPTLVVHGEEDRMIPIANAHTLADRIPGARLIELEGVGHLYPTEVPHVDERIGAFMRDHS